MEKRGCKITSQFHTSVPTLKDVCLAVCVFICVCDRNIAHRRIEVLFLGFECLRHTHKDDTLTFKTTYESRQLKHENRNRIVIVNSKFLKRHSKAKRRAPAYSRALRQIRRVFIAIVRGRLRSGCQRVRKCIKSEGFSKE